MSLGIRSAVMASLDAGQFAYRGFRHQKSNPIRRATTLGYMLRYIIIRPSTKPRTPMDIESVSDAWVNAIVQMCLSHSKDDFDAADAQADALLGPMLTAPVAQIRAFYARLLEKLRADKRVPFLVVMGYEAWGQGIVKDAPDEGIKRLKNTLAREISELAEESIRDQIPKAVERALRWRDPETLQEVKEALKGGAKPKLRGRESCLFLEIGRGKKKVSVML